jgi:hypothetical protein
MINKYVLTKTKYIYTFILYILFSFRFMVLNAIFSTFNMIFLWGKNCQNYIYFYWSNIHHYEFEGPSWPLSYGSWIYNYLCNHCLSPLKLGVRTLFMTKSSPYNIIENPYIYIYTHIYLYIYIMYTVFSSIIYKHNYCILFTMNIYYESTIQSD